MLTILEIATGPGESMVNIMELVTAALEQMAVKDGLCALIVPHTTAAITINSALDTATIDDITAEMRRLVPTRIDFRHQYDTPMDAAGHVKAALIGHSVLVTISEGRLLLGSSQSILFYEFDGPRDRKIQMKVIAG